MKIQVLDDLYNEINRLFIAGSKFSKNDPRIAKLIPPLQKMGEKSPALKKLADLTEKLTQADSNESAEILTETGVLLYSILYTQGDSVAETVGTDYVHENGFTPITELSYSRLKPIIDALTMSKSNRMTVLKDAFEQGRYNDYRLYPYYSAALEDKGAEFSEFLTGKIIPALGSVMISYLLEDFKIEKKSAAKRFALLDKMRYPKISELADYVMSNNSSVEVMAEVIKTIKDESYLLELTGHKKQEIRNAAFIALVKINSVKGLDLLLKTLSSDKYKSALEAAELITDDKYLNAILDIAIDCYQQIKNEPESKQRDAENNRLSALLKLVKICNNDNLYNLITEIAENSHNKKSFGDSVLREYYGWFSSCDNSKRLEFFENLYNNGKLKNADLHNFIFYYFAVAINNYNKKEVFKIFSPYYSSKKLFFYDSFIYKYEFDERWFEFFIKNKDIFLIFQIIKTQKSPKNPLKPLWEALKTFAQDEQIASKNSTIFGALVTCCNDKETDKIAKLIINCLDKYNEKINLFYICNNLIGTPEVKTMFASYINDLEKIANNVKGKNNYYIKNLIEFVKGGN